MLNQKVDYKKKELKQMLNQEKEDLQILYLIFGL